MARCLIRTVSVHATAPDGELPVYDIDLEPNEEVVRVHQFPLSGAGVDPCEWKANVDIVVREVDDAELSEEHRSVLQSMVCEAVEVDVDFHGGKVEVDVDPGTLLDFLDQVGLSVVPTEGHR